MLRGALVVLLALAWLFVPSAMLWSSITLFSAQNASERLRGTWAVWIGIALPLLGAVLARSWAGRIAFLLAAAVYVGWGVLFGYFGFYIDLRDPGDVRRMP